LQRCNTKEKKLATSTIENAGRQGGTPANRLDDNRYWRTIMPKHIMNNLPETVSVNDLALWFEQEPLPEVTLPARMTDLPDSQFWTSAAERRQYKLDKHGDPLPIDLSVTDAADFDHDLAIGYAMETPEIDVNINDYL
jgi:hypothetical protein